MACSNLNMGLTHFGPFLAQTWQFIGCRKNVHRSVKWQPERNKGSYFKIVALEQGYSDSHVNGTNWKTCTVW